MADALYSLEDHFDTLSRSCHRRASRSLASLASAFFALLGDALAEGRKQTSSLFSLPE